MREVRFGAAGPLATPSTAGTSCPAAPGCAGPAVIEELDSTTLVLPGQELHVLENGILRIARRPRVRRGSVASAASTA